MTARPDRSAPLAAYAVEDQSSRGRAHAEDVAEESPFELDRSRILACTAFRRLMHKTQVFVTDAGDHFRTRLTHTLEVALQAERLARKLRLNERLAAAIALAHDLGHPPFGHAGEIALAEAMRDYGGFEHNRQSLRVVDYLEHPYPAFRGLNLSFEVREALIKHRTRYDKPDERPADDSVIADLLATGPGPTLEGQVVNLADAIAYTLHDIEDGLLEAGLGEEVLESSRIWREASASIRKRQPGASVHAIRRPVLDEIARLLHEDAAAETARRLSAARIGTVDDARKAGLELVSFSEQARRGLGELQELLLKSVYRTHRVVRMDSKARRLIGDLFAAYLAEPALMPERFTRRIPEQGPHRVICDYIAGMTDRFCQEEHRRLFAPFHFG